MSLGGSRSPHHEQTKEGVLEVRRTEIVTGIAPGAAGGLGLGGDQALDAGSGLLGSDPQSLVLDGLDGVRSDAEHSAKHVQERRQFVENIHGHASPTGVDENLSQQC